jgi:hypothetical protein
MEWMDECKVVSAQSTSSRSSISSYIVMMDGMMMILYDYDYGYDSTH